MDIPKHMFRIVVHDGYDVLDVLFQVGAAAMPTGIRQGSMVCGERPHGCAVHTHDAIAFCDFHRVRGRDRTFYMEGAEWWEIKTFCETTPYCLWSASVS